jgi:colanic acid biosynthesis glycosyl transferase WcaI
MIKSTWTNNLVNGMVGAWCRFLYRQADIITVLSPGCKLMLEERGVPSEKVEVVYNWTDEETFRAVDYDPRLAKELGFEGYFNFVYAGNLGPLQNVDVIIRAAAMIKSEPLIRVLIIGTGPKRAELKKLAAEEGATNVRFLERRQFWEMPKINNLADVLLIHLTGAKFLNGMVPSKVQVSLASGRPVLIGIRGDSADIVRNAGAGLICEPDNPAEMARAMLTMAKMPKAQLAEMGSLGRDYYFRHLALNVGGGRMDEIFRRVHEHRKEGRPKRFHSEPSESPRNVEA